MAATLLCGRALEGERGGQVEREILLENWPIVSK